MEWVGIIWVIFLQCAFTLLLSFVVAKRHVSLGLLGLFWYYQKDQNIGVLGVNQNFYQSFCSSMRLHPPCEGADVRTDGRNRHPLSTPSAESGHVLVHPWMGDARTLLVVVVSVITESWAIIGGLASSKAWVVCRWLTAVGLREPVPHVGQM